MHPAARNLALGRIVIGLVSWLLPGVAGKLLRFDLAGNPQSVYFARLFGIRDVVLGVGTLAAPASSRRLWLQLGIACDAADTAAAVLGRRDGSLPASTALMAGGVAALATAQGAMGLAQDEEI